MEGLCKIGAKVPAHTTFVMTVYLARLGITTLLHPPYILNVNALVFFLLPKSPKIQKGQRIEDVTTIKMTITETLKEVTAADFKGTFEVGESPWQRPNDAQKDYFEKCIDCINTFFLSGPVSLLYEQTLYYVLFMIQTGLDIFLNKYPILSM